MSKTVLQQYVDDLASFYDVLDKKSMPILFIINL